MLPRPNPDKIEIDLHRDSTEHAILSKDKVPPTNWQRRLRQRLLRPLIIERCLMAADAMLIIGCSALSSYAHRWYAEAPQLNVTTYSSAGALVALNFVLLLVVQNGYQIETIAKPRQQLRMILATWTELFAALLAVGFTMKISEGFSRGAIISFFVLGLFVLVLCKLAASRLTSRAFRKGLFTNSRVVVVAEKGLVNSSSSLRELHHQGFRPARVWEISAAELSSPLVMSNTQNRFNGLIGYCRENEIEKVFLLFSWNRQHIIESILDALKVLPIPVHLVPDASVARFLKYPAVRAGRTWTTELQRAPLTQTERGIKRTLDICGALSAMVLFAPIMIVTSIFIKLDSNGPVLFMQTRNGFNGRSFRIFKFRTMRVAEDGSKIVQATRNDPRVTRIGRWLRKTSIDELPQLLNVLLGDMSLVGPRPHAAAHNSEYEQVIESYAFRHHVKPGITGWAQVNGYRGETNAIALMEKRVEFDLWYINNWSLWLDISIIFKTALTSFRQSKAY